MEESGKRIWRLLNRDGSFNVVRTGRTSIRFTDLYYSLLSMPWAHFLGWIVAYYFIVNLVFGAAFYECGPAALEGMRGTSELDRFLECFFFSVQTFATIGYGRISPASLPANVLVTLEALAGLLGFAMATGLLFARFARPVAKVLFSRNALITVHDGVPSLLFRIANSRLNQIVEAQVSVVLSITEATAEGESYRTFYDLKLERARTPIFALTWTVVHPIDAASPLKGATRESLYREDAELIVSLTGLDETYSQSIHARFSYTPEEILWNRFFEDMLRRTEDGKLNVDLSKIHEIRPAQDEAQAVH